MLTGPVTGVRGPPGSRRRVRGISLRFRMPERLRSPHWRYPAPPRDATLRPGGPSLGDPRGSPPIGAVLGLCDPCSHHFYPKLQSISGSLAAWLYIGEGGGADIPPKIRYLASYQFGSPCTALRRLPGSGSQPRALLAGRCRRCLRSLGHAGGLRGRGERAAARGDRAAVRDLHQVVHRRHVWHRYHVRKLCLGLGVKLWCLFLFVPHILF